MRFIQLVGRAIRKGSALPGFLVAGLFAAGSGLRVYVV
jgi:hypothetical protein